MILVDFDMLAHRCYRAMDHLHNSKGEPTGLEFGVMKVLSSLNNRLESLHKDHKIVLCLESRGIQIPKWYKAGRERPPDSFYVRKNTLLSNLKQIYAWALCRGEEADQVMYTLSQGKEFCYILSNDADLFQAISSTTVVVRSFKSQLFYWTKNELWEKYKVSPEQFAYYRAIKGDKTDNIKGIPRIPKMLAAEMARRIYNFYRIDYSVSKENREPSEALARCLAEFWHKVSPKMQDKFDTYIKDSLNINLELILFKLHLSISVIEPLSNSIQPFLDALEIKSLSFEEETEF